MRRSAEGIYLSPSNKYLADYAAENAWREDKLITAGFYSRYFHLTKESREKAAVYEAKLGSDRYWLALVSSVWQRSGIVVECAKSLRPVLIAQGYATEERLAQMERGPYLAS